jgi:hypothetical protein
MPADLHGYDAFGKPRGMTGTQTLGQLSSACTRASLASRQDTAKNGASERLSDKLLRKAKGLLVGAERFEEVVQMNNEFMIRSGVPEVQALRVSENALKYAKGLGLPCP